MQQLAADLSNIMSAASLGARADHREPECPSDEELERLDVEHLEDDDVNDMSLEDIQNVFC